MQIKSMVINKNAFSETDNGKYNLDYTIVNGKLTRVHASISKMNERQEEYHVGTITYEQETIGCNLPVNSPKGLFFEDFDSLMVQIRLDAKQYGNGETIEEINHNSN